MTTGQVHVTQRQDRRVKRSLWDKTWKDRRGRVVVWQTPNIALIGWVTLTFLSLLIGGRLADIFSWLGSAALIIWSLLEIFKGANYFRQALGLLVLVMAAMSLIKNI
jgi:hypothetical protein